MVISTVLKKENKENIPGARDAKHLEPLLPCFSPAGSCCLCRIHYSTCPSHWVVRRHGVEVAWYVGGHFVVVRSMFKWWFSRNKEIKSIKITNVVASRPAASTGLLYGDRSSSQSSLQWHLVTQQLETRDTVKTGSNGCGVTQVYHFGNRTRTCQTRSWFTAGWPAPVLHPSRASIQQRDFYTLSCILA